MRFLSIALALIVIASRTGAGTEVAQLSFDARFNQADVLAAEGAPAWITKVEQHGGAFVSDPPCWMVAAGGKEGSGRLEITLDRKAIGGNLVATVLMDADETADVALQLFDAQNRAVVVDLFGNLVDVGKDATTDTFIVPLHKYPTAEKLVLRRISGGLKVYGLALFPAVTEGTPVKEALQELARTLGDPLSPENPLVKGIEEIARNSKVQLDPATRTRVVAPAPSGNAPLLSPTKYAAAVTPPPGTAIPAAPTAGLVGHWSFQESAATDSSGGSHHGKLQAGASFAPGLLGPALNLRKNPLLHGDTPWDAVVMPHAPALDLKDSLTVSAWIKYTSIAGDWGSQIVWYGDRQLGRDPWELQLLPDGTLQLRSDRSVTERPVFTVFENEIAIEPGGRPQMNQHVSVESPGTLQRNQWYFVAGTIERSSPRVRTLRLFVNGAPVADMKTEETVNYDTSGMWMTIGAVDGGEWQNFDGQIGDVRVFNRPLSPTEIQALYRQPWK